MVKNAETKPVAAQDKNIAGTVAGKAKKLFVNLIVWVFFLGVLYGIWRNPQIISNMIDFVTTQTATEDSVDETVTAENDLYQQMAVLQNQVNHLQMQLASQNANNAEPVDLSRFDDKLEAIEKQNINVIDSKADVATVLGIITRLDKIEEKLDTLAKISDDGALVLTATMMVRESADNGTGFVYEAEILQQLAKNDADIKSDVETIARYAHEGVKTQDCLKREFAKIYGNLAKVKTQQDLEGKSWKEVLNIKLNEVVKVKRVNDLAAPQDEKQNEDSLHSINELVKNGDFRQALDKLHQMNDPALGQDAALQQWMKEAQARVNFNQAVANISAHSLALMKVNNIRNNNQ